MVQASDSAVRNQLLDRRKAVEGEIERAGRSAELDRLLGEVNGAIIRAEAGTFGLCEVCLEPMEPDRLSADPLVRVCLDHLSASEQRALERDLELAAKIQRGLLPTPYSRAHGWEITYHYQPARIVSGDYCDYLATDAGELYFMVGDVSGKGVAASLLMSHLHATLRTLILMDLPLEQLMTRASRRFCESALPAQYATLVCGKTTSAGDVEIANAGHPAPLLIRDGRIDRIGASGFPLGMFRNERFEIRRFSASPGATIVLYTDGVTEAEDEQGNQYGEDRLSATASRFAAVNLHELVQGFVKDVAGFAASATRTDDVTVVGVRRNVTTA
jgi:sigma-B regulation protein RsbU (phosphoserine phosphatase)